MRALWKPFDRIDGLLFVLAAAGLALLAFVLPGQHPDAGLDATLGPEGAVEAAIAVLTRNGYREEGLEGEATLMRQHDLLQGLQRELGRPRAVEVLQRDGALPAFLWSVSFYEHDAEEERRTLRHLVLLDEAGAFWHLENTSPLVPRVGREAVRYALMQRGGVVDETARLPAALTDSLLEARLAFDPGHPSWGRTPDEHLDGAPLADALLGVDTADRAPERLRAGAAVAFARHYLRRSALAHVPMRVDSAWTLSGRTDVAAVRFATAEPYLGQWVTTEVTVGAAGALLGMETRFDEVRSERVTADGEEAEGGGASIRVGLSGDGTASFVKIALYVLLTLLFGFVFVRRLSLRLIDVSTGLRDGLLAGGLAAAGTGLLIVPEMLREIPDPVVAYGIAALSTAMVAVATAVPLFLISAASDSVARQSWPSKQEALTLMRRAAVHNVPVGAALLRGTALAAVLTGLFVLFLVLAPSVAIEYGADGARAPVMVAEVVSPLLYYATHYGVFALFWTLSVLLGVGTMLYRWRPSALLVAGVVVLLAVLTRLSAEDVQPVAYAWTLAGTLGTALALAFWRYDVLTCLVGLFFFGLFVELAPGWLAEGLSAGLDAAAAFVLAALAAGVGAVGVTGGHTSAELPRYVPAYVTELAQQQRLQRELEIAYQVQESFLPTRMPQVEGVDLAAMCLAAHEVGGDYYDVVEVGPGRLALVIGDVSGKGIQAAFFMTLVKGMWQTLARTGARPAEVLTRLNALFCANAPRGTFVSLIYGVLDLEAGTFTFARAGHNPVIVKRRTGREAAFLRPPGMAIGLAAGDLFGESVEEVTLTLDHGDLLVFYTDGFSEAMNTVHEQFGDERLARRVERAADGTARTVLEAVSADVARFVEAAERHDDMTMLVIKLGAPTHAGPRLTNGAEAERHLEA